MKIYRYHPKTQEYCGEAEARLDPEEKKRGKTRYMVPGNATTVEPPIIPEKKKAIWDGEKWLLEDIPPANKIIITASKKIHLGKLQKAVRFVFPGVQIDGENLDQLVEKNIEFSGVSDIPENRIALQSIIDAHDYAAIIDQIEADARDINKALSPINKAVLKALLARHAISWDIFKEEVATNYTK